MSWFNTQQPCDMSPAFDALDRADAAARSACLQSRTLSRAIRCGDPIGFAEKVLSSGHLRARAVLRRLFPEATSAPPRDLPDDLAALMARADNLPGADEIKREASN